MSTNKNIISLATLLTIAIMPFSANATNRLFYKKADQYDIFKEVTGLSEDLFAKNNYFNRKIIYNKNGWSKYAGRHYHTTLSDLRKNTRNKQPFKQKGLFKVLYNTSIQEFIAGKKIRFNKTDHIAVQSASTNLTIEGGMLKRELDKKTKKTKDYKLKGSRIYKSQAHAVQGETLAIIFLYSTIYLHYVAARETLDLIINAPYLTNLNHQKFNPNKVNYNQIKIAFMKNAVPMFGPDTNLSHNFFHPRAKISLPRLKRRKKEQSDPTFSLIKTFAININKYKKQKFYHKNKKKIHTAAQRVLNTNYESSFRVAHLNGSNIIALTPLGGGAFGNNSQWILHAIQDKLSYCKKNNMKVYLVIPSKKTKQNEFWENLEY